MIRAGTHAVVMCVDGVMLPTAAPAQNLEAGKSPGQLFSNTCTACHRSPRGLLRTVPPGSLPGFLREHYTTSRDMAQQLSGFLIANGATDTRGRPQEARQTPAGVAQPPQQQPQQGQPPQQAQQPGRVAEPPVPQAGPQQQQQQQASRPPDPSPGQPQAAPEPRRDRRGRIIPDAAPGAEDARAARRALREQERAQQAMRERDDRANQKNRRVRISPARIEAATARGKDALPLGDVVKVDPVKPEVATPEPVKPEATKSETATAPSDATTRSDPVPQVTPAPANPTSAESRGGESGPSEPSRGSDEPPSGSTSAPAPAEPAPAAPSGARPAPPISQ